MCNFVEGLNPDQGPRVSLDFAVAEGVRRQVRARVVMQWRISKVGVKFQGSRVRGVPYELELGGYFPWAKMSVSTYFDQVQ